MLRRFDLPIIGDNLEITWDDQEVSSTQTERLVDVVAREIRDIKSSIWADNNLREWVAAGAGGRFGGALKKGKRYKENLDLRLHLLFREEEKEHDDQLYKVAKDMANSGILSDPKPQHVTRKAFQEDRIRRMWEMAQPGRAYAGSNSGFDFARPDPRDQGNWIEKKWEKAGLTTWFIHLLDDSHFLVPDIRVVRDDKTLLLRPNSYPLATRGGWEEGVVANWRRAARHIRDIGLMQPLAHFGKTIKDEKEIPHDLFLEALRWANRVGADEAPIPGVEAHDQDHLEAIPTERVEFVAEDQRVMIGDTWFRPKKVARYTILMGEQIMAHYRPQLLGKGRDWLRPFRRAARPRMEELWVSLAKEQVRFQIGVRLTGTPFMDQYVANVEAARKAGFVFHSLEYQETYPMDSKPGWKSWGTMSEGSNNTLFLNGPAAKAAAKGDVLIVNGEKFKVGSVGQGNRGPWALLNRFKDTKGVFPHNTKVQVEKAPREWVRDEHIVMLKPGMEQYLDFCEVPTPE